MKQYHLFVNSADKNDYPSLKVGEEKGTIDQFFKIFMIIFNGKYSGKKVFSLIRYPIMVLLALWGVEYMLYYLVPQ